MLAGACGRRVEDDGVPAESRGFVEAESGGERPHWFVTVYSLPAGAPPSRVRPQQAGGRCETERRLTATQKSRIATFGLACGANEGRIPKLSRRACTCEHGLQSWRGESAGVKKRTRERSPTRNPFSPRFAKLFRFAVPWSVTSGPVVSLTRAANLFPGAAKYVSSRR